MLTTLNNYGAEKLQNLNQKVVTEYDKNKGEMPLEKRKAILKYLKEKRFLTAKKIATVLNIQPQTVRCWLMEDNPRNISTAHCKTLCEFYGESQLMAGEF